MYTAFDFRLPQCILFGAGRFSEAATHAARFGGRALLVTGGQSLERTGRLAALEDQLRAAGVAWRRIVVRGEPTVSVVDQGAAEARRFQPDCVLSVGGGSVLDAGKAIAALLTNPGETLDYLEGVGRGRTLDQPALPHIAVPTTAGTGSEATLNAVITDDQHAFKKSMRADGMLPTVALVDPDLLEGCPAETAAACGMDAVTQLIEAYVARNASPFTDAFALQGLYHASRLADYLHDTTQPAARSSMALASLIGGICLANAGLCVVHSLASPLGAFFDAPHGVICAALLPPSVQLNVERAQAEGNRELLDKYCMAYDLLLAPDSAHAAAPMTRGGIVEALDFLNEPARGAQALALRLGELRQELNLPGLAHYGVTTADFGRIIDAAGTANLHNNPVELDRAALTRLLELAL
ncbi:MAG TPA: iron-containing alcohol dehydrogenase [Candidatus Sumerlaeota bacterium]|nr:iron-containing alcohol dehydrogenase [Candidatus Sumerlaeota bacterium]